MEVPVDSTCSSGNADHLVLGCSDGQACRLLSLLGDIEHAHPYWLLMCTPAHGLTDHAPLMQVVVYERGFSSQKAFKAHQQQVLHLVLLKVRPLCMLL